MTKLPKNLQSALQKKLSSNSSNLLDLLITADLKNTQESLDVFSDSNPEKIITSLHQFSIAITSLITGYDDLEDKLKNDTIEESSEVYMGEDEDGHSQYETSYYSVAKEKGEATHEMIFEYNDAFSNLENFIQTKTNNYKDRDANNFKKALKVLAKELGEIEDDEMLKIIVDSRYLQSYLIKRAGVS